ncbi:MAG: YdbL family protein [Betaproteobacteria bacterium]
MNRRFARRYWLRALLVGLWLAVAPVLAAETAFEFNVDSAAVMAIRKSLAQRHTLLKEHFEAGVIGLTHDGWIALREPASVAADVRARVELLVEEDNKDRGTLYRELARANGRPDWEYKFQSTFAARWIDRAPVGWYYRESGGQWVRKSGRDATGVPDGASAAASGAAPFPGN